MQFYHDFITQKSFEYLQKLKNKFQFILIGGWAVFLYTKSLKSKDIDIIVDYENLAKMKEAGEIRKNNRLKKYEVSEGNFDIDIYVPYYSELGMPIEEIQKNSKNKEGFTAPEPEILLLLKLYAWHNRRGSAKGQKDELDIFSLALLSEFDWRKYAGFVEKYDFSELNKEFKNLLKATRRIKDLNINEQKMAKSKKRILEKISYS
ncbi:hypothetical protein CO115_04285 [Candidatus Falkowbacteria bacterium CG_4_9_14_3_um_filter_36_9]|uniref:Uncharacterized protein n=2 Tax=Candidatus Falkowiibacteriota TaxID=1752728 RepID=A0A1J4T9Y8_9BACT|nr:MAG: hypothetical protein AUJ27_02750 [Candidatus Falkowbacteria bacterium CG1_02_37_44]PIV51792.1 MAG: hypothetical protein COS18_01965 [Candidatus Falkowbacteria bacterium CG02_land_8_20_14_3_00_36_14]PJA11015.1 MAG: hypothetical protein COX67_02045 [Candidatus Falkowbacteria bacterium CG_4_10_14_0_2_um_filter_36_22]PJB18564.1 MAG: hypothetical protein CO115_04285 [Candidatus Falkowbacteria bacterium CG_4_9_14_3_um_filter_36_9]